MNILNHGKTEDGKKYFYDFEISATDFAAAVKTAYQKNVGKINIPGFRPGHAPLNIIEKMYGENFFYEDALDELLPGAYTSCLETAKVKVIDRPEVDIKSADRKDGVKGTFSVLLRPELTVKNYKGLSAPKTEVKITDEDVEKEVEQLRMKGSRLVPVENRKAELGDTAVFDFEGFVDGVAFEGGKAEDYSLVLGSHQFIDNFEDQIAGNAPGDEFDVNVKFPEDYGEASLAGKAATFKVKLKELRMREMPAADDELAKDMSEFDTLDELKADLKKHLEEDAAEKSKEEFENAIMDKIVDELEGEVPEVMVEQRIDEDVNEFEYRLSGQGLQLKNYLKYIGQTAEEFRKSFTERAEKQVKVRLALEAITRAENIEVTDEDVTKEFERIAEQYKMEIDKIKTMIDAEDLKDDIATNRALDIVTSNAVAE